jgi:hypothetical protein
MMRLNAKALAICGSEFTALQAVVVAGGGNMGLRKVMVRRASGRIDWFEKNDDVIRLSPGDEVEILPRAESSFGTVQS